MVNQDVLAGYRERCRSGISARSNERLSEAERIGNSSLKNATIEVTVSAMDAVGGHKRWYRAEGRFGEQEQAWHVLHRALVRLLSKDQYHLFMSSR
jgi:hypothetical protein